MKKIYFGLLSLIFLCSLVVNTFYFQSWISEKQQMKYVEAHAMERFSNNISQASRWMSGDPTAAISRLTEASGTFSTLYNVLPSSVKQSTRKQLYNISYYLHYQGTATSHNGLSQFIENANELLQSHISKGSYDVDYFSSDLTKIEKMLPKSFPFRTN